MDLKGRLKRLFEDAVSVWRDPEARRPLTRRGVDESALLEAYRRSQKGENETPDAADESRKKKQQVRE